MIMIIGHWCPNHNPKYVSLSRNYGKNMEKPLQIQCVQASCPQLKLQKHRRCWEKRPMPGQLDEPICIIHRVRSLWLLLDSPIEAWYGMISYLKYGWQIGEIWWNHVKSLVESNPYFGDRPPIHVTSLVTSLLIQSIKGSGDARGAVQVLFRFWDLTRLVWRHVEGVREMIEVWKMLI